MSRASLVACILLPFFGSAQPANLARAKRVALIIGNSNYTTLPPLRSVPQDVTLISEALSKAGFEIHQVADFQWPAFFRSFQTDAPKLFSPGDVCVVYYAGYAVQGEDDNYLLPVNFDPQKTGEMQSRALHLKTLQEALNSIKVALQIYMLEAPPSMNVALAGMTGVGLSEPQITRDNPAFFFSAARLGEWALPPVPDGTDLFTSALGKALGEPGLELETLFDRVRREVAGAGGQPYHLSSMLSEFYFRAPEPKISSVAIPPAPKWPRPGIPTANTRDREEYLWIPPGTFMMGCVPADKRCHEEERPRHQVTLTRGFWLGRNEVTVDSYRRYIEFDPKLKLKMPSGPNDDRGWKIGDRPIVNVRWDNAQQYCTWAGGRLPSEAEWEYAARGGATDEVVPNNSEASREKANFDGKAGNDKYDFLAPVRKFDPNPYGLFDMAGNVWEWINDWFSPTAYTADPVTDPKGPPEGKEHVIRGGSWNSDPKEHLRISFRKGFGKDFPNVGFRCAIEDTAESRKLLPEPALVR